jgi:hypothetical protein
MSTRAFPIAVAALSLIAAGCARDQSPRPPAPATPNAPEVPTPPSSSPAPQGTPNPPPASSSGSQG